MFLILEKYHRRNLNNKTKEKEYILSFITKKIIPIKTNQFIFVSIKGFSLNCSIFKFSKNKIRFSKVSKFSLSFIEFCWKIFIKNSLTNSNKIFLDSYYLDLVMGEYRGRNYYPFLIIGSILRWILFFKRFKRICLRSEYKPHIYNYSSSNFLNNVRYILYSILYFPSNPPIDIFVNFTDYDFTKNRLFAFYREFCRKIISTKDSKKNKLFISCIKNNFLYVDNGLYFLHPDNIHAIPISDDDRYNFALDYSKKIVSVLNYFEILSKHSCHISLHPKAQNVKDFFPAEALINERASLIFQNYYFCITGYSSTYYEISNAKTPCLLLRDKLVEKYSFNARDMGIFFEKNNLPFCWTDSDKLEIEESFKLLINFL